MTDTSTHHEAPVTPGETGEKPFGPVAAMFLSVGIGGLVLGILTTLAEASATIKDKLELSARVGPLSGKTIFSVVAWLVAWAILHPILKDKDVNSKKIFIWTAIMFGVAVILTFPLFFQMFTPAE